MSGSVAAIPSNAEEVAAPVARLEVESWTVAMDDQESCGACDVTLSVVRDALEEVHSLADRLGITVGVVPRTVASRPEAVQHAIVASPTIRAGDAGLSRPGRRRTQPAARRPPVRRRPGTVRPPVPAHRPRYAIRRLRPLLSGVTRRSCSALVRRPYVPCSSPHRGRSAGCGGQARLDEQPGQAGERIGDHPVVHPGPPPCAVDQSGLA